MEHIALSRLVDKGLNLRHFTTHNAAGNFATDAKYEARRTFSTTHRVTRPTHHESGVGDSLGPNPSATRRAEIENGVGSCRYIPEYPVGKTG